MESFHLQFEVTKSVLPCRFPAVPSDRKHPTVTTHPDHDLVFGNRGARRFDGVRVEEQIEGDVGDRAGLVQSLIAVAGLTVGTGFHFPSDIDIERSDARQRQGQRGVIKSNIGIGVHRFRCSVPVPRGGEAGRIVGVVEGCLQLDGQASARCVDVVLSRWPIEVS